MARTDPQLNIRCPQELRDRLEQAANDKKRSLTAEVVTRLEASFEPLATPSSFGLEQMELITKMAGASYMLMLQKRIEDLSDDEALKAIRSLIKEVSADYKHLIDNVGGLRSKPSK